MKKLGCAKCGGTKKMKLGGSAVAKAPVNIFGIPQQNLGTSGQSGNMKKGGTTKVHPLVAFQKFNDDRNKKLAKAQLGISTGQKFPARDTSAMKKYDDKRLTDIQSKQSKQAAEFNLKSAMKSGMDKFSKDSINKEKTDLLNKTIEGYRPTRKSGGATKSLPKLVKSKKK